MRRTLTAVTLWMIAAVITVVGGAATVMYTGDGVASPSIVGQDEVKAALDDASPVPGSSSKSDPYRLPPGKTKVTKAGTVTVSCADDYPSNVAAIPSAGWFVANDDTVTMEVLKVSFLRDTDQEEVDVFFACRQDSVYWLSPAEAKKLAKEGPMEDN